MSISSWYASQWLHLRNTSVTTHAPFFIIIDISNIWRLLHSSIKHVPTLLKLYIHPGLVLIACALPVRSIFPSFLKNLEIKVESKIISTSYVLCILKINMTTLKLTLFSHSVNIKCLLLDRGPLFSHYFQYNLFIEIGFCLGKYFLYFTGQTTKSLT